VKKEKKMIHLIARLVLLSTALSTALHATDYTKMAQEIVQDSYARQPEASEDGQQGVQDFFNLQEPSAPAAKTLPSKTPGTPILPHSGIQKTCPSGVCKAATLTVKQKQRHPDSSQVLIFVSFSMPEASLIAYAKDVAKIGGRLVFQGLVDDSFQATQQKFLKLGLAADIDPTLFETFAVKRVPLIVHAPIIQGEIQAQGADQLLGHVSLTYALEQFKDKGEIAGCQGYLKKLSSGER
jgi:type-F conjugative transfer system pilin assembly protein TrbC